MKLTDLFSTSSQIKGDLDSSFESIDVQGLCYDSRKVKKGDLFFAMKGVHSDGHQFLEDVFRRGAVAAVVDTQVSTQIPCIQVPSVPQAMSVLSHIFYGKPSHKIPVIAVTGTNGKTTTTYLLETMFRRLGKNCAVMGTINYRVNHVEIPAPNTTPMSMDVHQFIQQAHQEQAEVMAMEVSSHALEQFRVDQVKFDVGIFTNLTQDHLDFHKDMESYFRAKARLFRDYPGIKPVINLDDPYGRRLAKDYPKGLTFGFAPEAMIRAENAVSDLSGIHFDLVMGNKRFPVRSNLVGKHNIYNVLGACAALKSMEIPEEKIAESVQQKFTVPGRLERVEAGQKFVVVVDYAHSEDALIQVLKTLRETNPDRLFCVFGAGGDRDRTKRPKMGRAAAELSDYVFVTSDNPRSEVPLSIIKEIEAGIQSIGKTNYEIHEDRALAIRAAIQKASDRDIVLIAGKGHETYQIYGTKKIHFSDQETAFEAIKNRS